MSFEEASSMHIDDVEWPAFVAVPPDKTLQGAPRASTLVLQELPRKQMGVWQVTPGAFSTDHTGYVEFMHIISGRGRVVSTTDVTTELSAGSTLFLPSGWVGRWEIDEALTKAFTIIHDENR